jgi:predicted nucleotidyltransferase
MSTKDREIILTIAVRHGARNVRMFGSRARGETGNQSDLDLVVDLEPGRSLLDHVGLWQDLEDALGCKVDVVVEGGISPYLEDRILLEARPI